MKAESLSEIKRELNQLEASHLVQLCLALAKYKKDNKDYLSYLLFRAHDRQAVLQEIRQEIDLEFEELKRQSNLYFAKKSLRRILRSISRYSKYLGDKAASAELYIHFCLSLKQSAIPFTRSPQLSNLYAQQVKKINTLVSALHEDLQGDYTNDLERIAL